MYNINCVCTLYCYKYFTLLCKLVPALCDIVIFFDYLRQTFLDKVYQRRTAL